MALSVWRGDEEEEEEGVVESPGVWFALPVGEVSGRVGLRSSTSGGSGRKRMYSCATVAYFAPMEEGEGEHGAGTHEASSSGLSGLGNKPGVPRYVQRR